MINYWQMFIVMFCAINPVLAMVINASLKLKLNYPERIIVAGVCSLSVFSGLSLGLIYGKSVLNFLGIAFYIIELGGGLLILMIGTLNILANEYIWEARYYLQKLTMTFGMSSPVEKYKLNANMLFDNPESKLTCGLGFSPLALPVMLNPASLLIAIFFSNQVTIHSKFAVLGIMLVLSLAIFLLLMASSYLVKQLSQLWLLTINRISGLFLTVIALEMFISGFHDLLTLFLN